MVAGWQWRGEAWLCYGSVGCWLVSWLWSTSGLWCVCVRSCKRGRHVNVDRAYVFSCMVICYSLCFDEVAS